MCRFGGSSVEYCEVQSEGIVEFVDFGIFKCEIYRFLWKNSGIVAMLAIMKYELFRSLS